MIRRPAKRDTGPGGRSRRGGNVGRFVPLALAGGSWQIKKSHRQRGDDQSDTLLAIVF
jgi:hypothetical protein